jgi:hypothetical protein
MNEQVSPLELRIGEHADFNLLIVSFQDVVQDVLLFREVKALEEYVAKEIHPAMAEEAEYELKGDYDVDEENLKSVLDGNMPDNWYHVYYAPELIIMDGAVS